MNFLRSNTIKQISASALMALFVFVFAVKAFHFHDYSYIKNKTLHQATTVSVNFFCSICEFQLAKDIDATKIFIDLVPPVLESVILPDREKKVRDELLIWALQQIIKKNKHAV